MRRKVISIILSMAMSIGMITMPTAAEEIGVSAVEEEVSGIVAEAVAEDEAVSRTVNVDDAQYESGDGIFLYNSIVNISSAPGEYCEYEEYLIIEGAYDAGSEFDIDSEAETDFTGEIKKIQFVSKDGKSVTFKNLDDNDYCYVECDQDSYIEKDGKYYNMHFVIEMERSMILSKLKPGQYDMVFTLDNKKKLTLENSVNVCATKNYIDRVTFEYDEGSARIDNSGDYIYMYLEGMDIDPSKLNYEFVIMDDEDEVEKECIKATLENYRVLWRNRNGECWLVKVKTDNRAALNVETSVFTRITAQSGYEMCFSNYAFEEDVYIPQIGSYDVIGSYYDDVNNKIYIQMPQACEMIKDAVNIDLYDQSDASKVTTVSASMNDKKQLVADYSQIGQMKSCRYEFTINNEVKHGYLYGFKYANSYVSKVLVNGNELQLPKYIEVKNGDTLEIEYVMAGYSPEMLENGVYLRDWGIFQKDLEYTVTEELENGVNFGTFKINTTIEDMEEYRTYAVCIGGPSGVMDFYVTTQSEQNKKQNFYIDSLKLGSEEFISAKDAKYNTPVVDKAQADKVTLDIMVSNESNYVIDDISASIFDYNKKLSEKTEVAKFDKKNTETVNVDGTEFTKLSFEASVKDLATGSYQVEIQSGDLPIRYSRICIIDKTKFDMSYAEAFWKDDETLIVSIESMYAQFDQNNNYVVRLWDENTREILNLKTEVIGYNSEYDELMLAVTGYKRPRVYGGYDEMYCYYTVEHKTLGLPYTSIRYADKWSDDIKYCQEEDVQILEIYDYTEDEEDYFCAIDSYDFRQGDQKWSNGNSKLLGVEINTTAAPAEYPISVYVFEQNDTKLVASRAYTEASRIEKFDEDDGYDINTYISDIYFSKSDLYDLVENKPYDVLVVDGKGRAHTFCDYYIGYVDADVLEDIKPSQSVEADPDKTMEAITNDKSESEMEMGEPVVDLLEKAQEGEEDDDDPDDIINKPGQNTGNTSGNGTTTNNSGTNTNPASYSYSRVYDPAKGKVYGSEKDTLELAVAKNNIKKLSADGTKAGIATVIRGSKIAITNVSAEPEIVSGGNLIKGKLKKNVYTFSAKKPGTVVLKMGNIKQQYNITAPAVNATDKSKCKASVGSVVKVELDGDVTNYLWMAGKQQMSRTEGTIAVKDKKGNVVAEVKCQGKTATVKCLAKGNFKLTAVYLNKKYNYSFKIK